MKQASIKFGPGNLGPVTTNLGVHYIQKQLYSFLFFTPVYNYKVRTNLWPQSNTQLHANIQLDSLVTSWPSFYALHSLLKIASSQHPWKLWTPRMEILLRESPHWPLPVHLGYVLFNPWWKPCVLYQLVPHFPFYVLLLYLSVSSNRCCRCNWWSNHSVEGPVVTHHVQNPLLFQVPTHCEEGSMLMQKWLTAHLLSPWFPYSVFTLLCQKCSLWNSNFVVDLPLNS